MDNSIAKIEEDQFKKNVKEDIKIDFIEKSIKENIILKQEIKTELDIMIKTECDIKIKYDDDNDIKEKIINDCEYKFKIIENSNLIKEKIELKD
jgi:hypothetical protein